MKFNKSEIMRNAWNMVKTAGMTISTALKTAWAVAKRFDRHYLTLKGWFFDKMNAEAKRWNIFCDMERICENVKVVVEEVIAESEKAIKVRLSSGEVVGSCKGWTTWIPKSCIVK